MASHSTGDGGIPPREDLQKFVGELFPNEVQVSATGPVPIERPFELTDVSGVGSVEADAVEVDDRPSFSGGEVDERTPHGADVVDAVADHRHRHTLS